MIMKMMKNASMNRFELYLGCLSIPYESIPASMTSSQPSVVII